MASNRRIIVLGEDDVDVLRAMLDLFGGAFDDHEAYRANQPDNEYLKRLLKRADSYYCDAERDD